jgi:hypothetical protein
MGDGRYLGTPEAWTPVARGPTMRRREHYTEVPGS